MLNSRCVLGVFLCIFIFYAVIIPFVFTMRSSGCVGITGDNHSMAIDRVIPSFDTHLWCYEGLWNPDEEIKLVKLPDGVSFFVRNSSFHGYCYISDMTLQK